MTTTTTTKVAVTGTRAHDGTARFDIWPAGPSLTPLHRNFTWSQAFRFLMAEGGVTVPAVTFRLHEAMDAHDGEVGNFA